MSQTGNCSKCGYNGFRTELRQVQVQFGANSELQLAGVASAVICEKCGAIHIPNTFNVAPTAWTPPQASAQPSLQPTLQAPPPPAPVAAPPVGMQGPPAKKKAPKKKKGTK